MPYIGNDIVDMTGGRKSTDLRFLRKILTDSEIEQVRGADNPEAALWSYWACKESAYKVLQKKTGGAAFVPRRWRVCYQTDSGAGGFSSEDCREGTVWADGAGVIAFSLFFHPAYIHCLASDEIGGLERSIAGVDRLPGDAETGGIDSSLFVRKRLIRRLAGAMRLPEENLQIIRHSMQNELGPPLLYVTGRPSAVDLSLSHDGRYVAYAYLS